MAKLSADSSTQPPVSPSSKYSAIRIAVVDDDQACRESLALLLNTVGVTCEAHASVAAFIHANAVHRVHCLILDILMPEIDGFALQSCLRGTNFEIPIIFCSGLSDDEAKHTALANGAVSFLRKPVKKETLLRAVRSALPALFPSVAASDEDH
jgi:two-component system, LuxR family, response regulator FixJ